MAACAIAQSEHADRCKVNAVPRVLAFALCATENKSLAPVRQQSEEKNFFAIFVRKRTDSFAMDADSPHYDARGGINLGAVRRRCRPEWIGRTPMTFGKLDQEISYEQF